MAKQYRKASENNSEAFTQLTGIDGTVPPQAVELERAVLGALMLERDAIIDVQEYVKVETFYLEEHRQLCLYGHKDRKY
jgi:replicative DNA helicase